jgi:hypothetical protein
VDNSDAVAPLAPALSRKDTQVTRTGEESPVHDGHEGYRYNLLQAIWTSLKDQRNLWPWLSLIAIACFFGGKNVIMERLLTGPLTLYRDHLSRTRYSIRAHIYGLPAPRPGGCRPGRLLLSHVLRSCSRQPGPLFYPWMHFQCRSTAANL